MLAHSTYTSPTGNYILCAHNDSVCGIWRDEQAPKKHLTQATANPNHPTLKNLSTWLDKYFAGENPDPTTLKLQLEGTSFQLLVWEELLTIPYGHTESYGAIARRVAKRVGKPNMSAQAIGGAVGKNPISIVIPCHRVVGAKGQLTGYAGGIATKQWLLEHEHKHGFTT
ncbi:methylated-DNA--[protein]-cysteine S-methyltransferase [Corynebacterium felinum]|uniref:Methylated-DNA--protein-cysteine methyltransferase n=1 Tax=Corynebacterium felinum TaxID=131318 RepID=A0ABU2BBL5_9CORY|nr:methylated-DNA--[protein]-cysteine S-methyltransferase [Corynebacterium felinum]MDF5819836.1 methylated-DNA--[protein]-cysteine S-methyltransferase [Corynebacterium felinum]MDR7356022.1 methylated-DNA-[protein]-cysteine S-methyltransferase [Corynebacterium felinum]WJY95357.1 Methylated-DNA--protein-cysteine methyltransferase [Corynebacterium felinum]